MRLKWVHWCGNSNWARTCPHAPAWGSPVRRGSPVTTTAEPLELRNRSISSSNGSNDGAQDPRILRAVSHESERLIEPHMIALTIGPTRAHGQLTVVACRVRPDE